MNWTYRIRLACIALVVFGLAFPAAARLRVGENQRHFVDGDQPVMLFGSGIWTIIPDPTIDIEEHNTWYGEWSSNANRATLFAFSTSVPDGQGLAPWKRTGPGEANDGLPKFDLTVWDEAFWDRLHAYLESCKRHEIYVWLQIFDEPYTEPGMQRWYLNPFNDENNINALPGMPGGDGDGPWGLYGVGEEAFYDPDNEPLMDIQNTLLQRLLDETATRYGHIIYEIGNEINADSVAPKALEWQRHWIRLFREYEQAHDIDLILSNNTRRSLAEADADGFDVLNHNAFGEIPVRGVAPLELARNIARRVGDDFTRFRQPIVNSRPASDPDRVDYPDVVSPDEGRCLYWSYFMSGGHIVGFRTTEESWKSGVNAETIIRNLHRFIDETPFDQMEPDQDRVEGDALCFAQLGQAYALYFPVGGKATLQLSDEENELTLRWYNPRSGEWHDPESLTPESQGLALESPDDMDWAVLILRP